MPEKSRRSELIDPGRKRYPVPGCAVFLYRVSGVGCMMSLALGGRKDLFANRNGEYGENGEYGGRARQELHLDRKSE